MSSLQLLNMWFEETAKLGPNRMRGNLPLILPHTRIGLLGGSFDPPHQGHVQVSLSALKQLNLHHMIWLVSPQNPLKQHKPAPVSERLKAARKITASHPHISASDIESKWRTQYTIETIRNFQTLYPNVEFIWVIGSDNWANFHKWRGWVDIINAIPVAIYPRPGHSLKAGLGPAAQRFRSAQRNLRAPQIQAPAWQMLTGPHKYEASSQMRHMKQDHTR